MQQARIDSVGLLQCLVSSSAKPYCSAPVVPALPDVAARALTCPQADGAVAGGVHLQRAARLAGGRPQPQRRAVAGKRCCGALQGWEGGWGVGWKGMSGHGNLTGLSLLPNMLATHRTAHLA